jgi:impB/mucB/samB family C-terminal domain/Double zinc ribbon domain
MDAQETLSPSPTRSISTHLRGALRACRGVWKHTARLALDIALPTLCVACREPVDGDGVCAACWAKLSFIAPPFCPRLGIPFIYDPGPGLLSMEAIANPPAYQRARAAVRYDDVARTLVHALKYQDRTDLAPAMGRWMARAGRELLDEAHFGKAGSYYYWISRGVDNREVRAGRIRKSVGAENTFYTDLTEFEAMAAELQPLIDKVWRHCEDKGARGRTVTLKVKFADFELISRSRTLAGAIGSRDELETASAELLKSLFPMEKAVRLLGVAISGFSNAAMGSSEQIAFAL